MKLEIRHAINEDGEFYRVYADNKIKASFYIAEDGSNREERLQDAKNKVEALKTPPTEETIFTEEI